MRQPKCLWQTGISSNVLNLYTYYRGQNQGFFLCPDPVLRGRHSSMDNFTQSGTKTVQLGVWPRDWRQYVSILFPTNDKKKQTTRVWISVYKHSNLTSTQKTRNFKVNECIYFYVYLFYICVCAYTYTHIYWSKHFQKTRKRLFLFDKKEGKGMDCSKYSLASTE